MDAFEGIVSMSDTLGNLLFYTNGGGRPAGNGGPDNPDQSPGIIWNRNHEVMYDMRGEEGGGFSARQSCIAMPDPGGQAGIYYLFTMEEAEFDAGGSVVGQPQGRGLSYFVIDMNLNGGLGGVSRADQRVLEGVYEALDATPMADGTGYWIICHNNDPGGTMPQIFVTPLTAAGVGAPVTSEVPFATNGRLEFSPDGNFLYHNGRVLAFDNASGQIGTTLNTFDNASSSACFTPDSRFLYYTEGRLALGTIISRYNLTDFSREDIARLTVNPGDVLLQTAGFQIGPNGNIYFVEELINGLNRRYGLSEIICVSSPNPTVNRFILDLAPFGQGDFRPQALPQYVDAIFAEPVVEDTLLLDTLALTRCTGDPVILRPRELGMDYLWSTGATSDTLVVSEGGTYCVTVTGGCQPTVDCQQLDFVSPGATAVLVRTEDRGCDGLFCVIALTDPPLDIDSTFVQIRIPLINGIQIRYAEWFSADTLSFPKPREGELLNVSIRTACGTANVPIGVLPEGVSVFDPMIRRISEEAPCDGGPLSLEVFLSEDSTRPLERVRWSNGDTTSISSFAADADEQYFATAFTTCEDSVVVDYTEFIEPICDCQAEIPELITPNGDGTNDVFRVFSNCVPEEYTMMVFNRWGQKIFSSTNPTEVWDGAINGTPQNQDVYLYRTVFRLPGVAEPVVREGQVSLVR